MPSNRVTRRLQDITDNAKAIFQYTEGMDAAAFLENRMVYCATERCLERICEAATKLGDMAAYLMPDQPWHKIRAFGNVLRHEYDTIEHDRLFDIVKTDLPGLYAACEVTLQKVGPEQEQAQADADYIEVAGEWTYLYRAVDQTRLRLVDGIHRAWWAVL